MFIIAASGCLEATPETSNSPAPYQQSYTSIYWSDADSGRLGELKFRIANKDAPEAGSLKQRGGAKCEAERELGQRPCGGSARRQIGRPLPSVPRGGTILL